MGMVKLTEKYETKVRGSGGEWVKGLCRWE